MMSYAEEDYWDRQVQKEKEINEARKEIRKLGFKVTFFPVEYKYIAWIDDGDYTEVSPFCQTIPECLKHVKKYMKENNMNTHPIKDD